MAPHPAPRLARAVRIGRPLVGALREAPMSPGGEGGSASDPAPGSEGGSRTAPTAEQAAQTLAVSAARGRELARLLDSDAPVPGVTTGQLRPEIAAIAVPATTDGRNMTGDDFAVNRGLGPLRVRRGGYARPRPCRRTRLHPRRA